MMIGTKFFRRASAIVAGSTLLAVTSCGVEFNGLFEGVEDAAIDGAAPSDAGRDNDSTYDGASDRRPEAGDDIVSSDVSINDARGEVGNDAKLDGAVIDVSFEGDVASDVSFEADAKSADAAQDRSNEPPSDASSGDVATDADAKRDTLGEASLDTASEASFDVKADTPSDGSDAGPPGTCSGVCNTFDNIGATITRTVDPGAAPLMTGGTIVDGTYVATSAVHYNGDNSAYSLAETSIIAGNVDAWVSSINGQTAVRYTTTFSIVNNQLVFAFCCPMAADLTINYTTDGVSLSHVDPANPNRVITYTKQ